MIDVLVVGGGPVGLATAVEARRAGLSVLVLEPRSQPIDKACGEGLMPGALAALERLGVNPEGHVISGISYQAGGRRVDHEFRRRPGRGVRRTALHSALDERASLLGVDVVPGTMEAFTRRSDSIVGHFADGTDVPARWLIGCDGLHSKVSELAGLDVPSRGTRRFGLRQHFAVAPWSDLVEVHWTPTAELYVTPVGENEVGVAVLGPRHTNFDDVIHAVPALAERLSDAATTSSLRGAGPFRKRTSSRTSGRVMLVGDASGYVDAITGEGIRVGLAQARVAMESIVANDAQRYEREWHRVTRDFRMLTSGLVALGNSPLRGSIVPLARTVPFVFGSIVERLAR